MSARTWPLRVSGFLLLEFRQLLRLQSRLHPPERGFPGTEAQRMMRCLPSDLATRVWPMVAVDWSDVHQRAEALSARHTESGGHRLADILHVATALHPGAEEFLTFDTNQKKLATGEGMKIRV